MPPRWPHRASSRPRPRLSLPLPPLPPPPLPLRLLLLLLLWSAALPPSLAISAEARRVQANFTQLSVSNGSSAEPPLPKCPFSIAFTRIRSYRAINPADPDAVYDGILWEALLVDGVPCQSSTFTSTATFFQIPPADDPSTPPSAATPWFLLALDNSPRRCGDFQAQYPARYFFTDNLPRFRDRLVRDGLLPLGTAVNPVRGDIYMFVVPTVDGGDAFSAEICAYQKARPPPSPRPSPTPEPGAVCLSRYVRVPVVRGGPVAHIEELSVAELVVGDRLAVSHAVAHRLRDTALANDVVVSSSHADPTLEATFIAITALNLASNRTTTVELTPNHLLARTRTHWAPARSLRVGHALLSASATTAEHDAHAIVVRLRNVRRIGVFAPVTRSGAIVAGDLVLSCYTELTGAPTAHALLAPIRAASWLSLRDWRPLIDALRVPTVALIAAAS